MLERQQQKKQVTSITEFWALAGQPPSDRRNDNPRYALFKSKVEGLSVGIQSTGKEGAASNEKTEEIVEQPTP